MLSELIYTEKKLYTCEWTRLNWEKTLCVWANSFILRKNSMRESELSFILRKNSMRESELVYSEEKLYACERILIYT